MNRKIDEVGRLVIPKEMRDKLNLKNGDEVKIELVDNKIIISNSKDKWNDLKDYLEDSWIKTQDIWFVKLIEKMKELEKR